MSGNRIGGIKARNTNKEKYDKECMEKYGMTYYQYIGQLGGVKGKTGGFASNKVGSDGLTGKERAVLAGKKAGALSKRGHRYLRTEAGYRFYVALDTGNVVRYKHAG